MFTRGETLTDSFPKLPQEAAPSTARYNAGCHLQACPLGTGLWVRSQGQPSDNMALTSAEEPPTSFPPKRASLEGATQRRELSQGELTVSPYSAASRTPDVARTKRRATSFFYNKIYVSQPHRLVDGVGCHLQALRHLGCRRACGCVLKLSPPTIWQ